MMPNTEDNMARRLGTHRVDEKSLEGQLDWASNVLSQITDRHAKALDIQSWKIVHKEDSNHRWPFHSQWTGCAAPDWCEDWA